HGRGGRVRGAVHPRGDGSRAQRRAGGGPQARAVLGSVPKSGVGCVAERWAMRTTFTAAILLGTAFSAHAEETVVKVGFCARTITSAAAPFAIAMKRGWYAKAGMKVQLVPVPGSTDCVKLVATGDLPWSLPSIEPIPAA